MGGASLELLATGISILHLVWILLLIFGAFWTRRRPFWTAVHLLSLVWGIIVEVGPWPCPLTLAEQYLQGGASLRGGYILHCVDSLVYPNLPYWVVAACGVVVCGVNLGVYARRGWVWLQRRKAAWRC